MRRLSTKMPLLLCAACAVLALGACGSSHTPVTTGTYSGGSGKNAPYLNVGPLVYQVQVSRQLNPYDTEDSNYVTGLPHGETLHPGEEWFGVFMQVYNQTPVPHLAASDYTISDTDGNVYHPVALGPTNLFAYRAINVPGHGRLPELNTVAANGSTQGALLLYKIKLASLANPPLELKIVGPGGVSETASAELDV